MMLPALSEGTPCFRSASVGLIYVYLARFLSAGRSRGCELSTVLACNRQACKCPACVQVMGREEQLVSAVHWLDINLSFDLDARVHVFELTIRALGELTVPNNLDLMTTHCRCSQPSASTNPLQEMPRILMRAGK